MLCKIFQVLMIALPFLVGCGQLTAKYPLPAESGTESEVVEADSFTELPVQEEDALAEAMANYEADSISEAKSIRIEIPANDQSEPSLATEEDLPLAAALPSSVGVGASSGESLVQEEIGNSETAELSEIATVNEDTGTLEGENSEPVQENPQPKEKKSRDLVSHFDEKLSQVRVKLCYQGDPDAILCELDRQPLASCSEVSEVAASSEKRPHTLRITYRDSSDPQNTLSYQLVAKKVLEVIFTCD